MAVKIQETQHRATSFVNASSRYASSRVILVGEEAVPAFELYKGRHEPHMDRGVQWSQITPNVEFRPDLVSHELYGTPDFWWKIMEINRMKDILEFRAGRVIMVPTSVLA